MKIGDRQRVSDPQLGGGPSGPEQSGGLPAGGTAALDDQVEVSRLARLLATATGPVGGTDPGAGPQRLGALQAQIDAGSYHVDEHDVARAFLGDVLGG